eukprot:1052476_1
MACIQIPKYYALLRLHTHHSDHTHKLQSPFISVLSSHFHFNISFAYSNTNHPSYLYAAWNIVSPYIVFMAPAIVWCVVHKDILFIVLDCIFLVTNDFHCSYFPLFVS